jgi:hypothetical protein
MILWLRRLAGDSIKVLFIDEVKKYLSPARRRSHGAGNNKSAKVINPFALLWNCD